MKWYEARPSFIRTFAIVATGVFLVAAVGYWFTDGSLKNKVLGTLGVTFFTALLWWDFEFHDRWRTRKTSRPEATNHEQEKS